MISVPSRNRTESQPAETAQLFLGWALKPGDQVRLTSGPFADFVGTIESIAPERRVWVLIEIMGGQTRVAVAADHLRMA